MKQSVRIAAIVAAALIIAACGGSPVLSAREQIALRAISDSAARSMQTGDWTTWASLFTEEGVVQPPGEKPVSGRAALALWGKKFPMFESVNFEDQQYAGDAHFAMMTSRVVMKMKDAAIDTGKQVVTFAKQEDGKWLVSALSYSSNFRAPIAAPAPKPQTVAVAKPAAPKPATKRTVASNKPKATTRTAKTTSKAPAKSSRGVAKAPSKSKSGAGKQAR